MKRIAVVIALCSIALLMGAQPEGQTPPGPTLKATAPLLYIVTFTPGETWAQGKPFLQQAEILQHLRYWQARTDSGELVASGMIDEGAGGAVSLIQAEDLAAAKKLVDEDPLVKLKRLKPDIHTWRAITWMPHVDFPGAAAWYHKMHPGEQPAGK